MSWDWSSLIALSLFLLMCDGYRMLLGNGAAVASSSARSASRSGSRRP
jgi:hypothetical protein